ncbi:MAG: P-type Ca2+ transporter type [Thermoproteota archaeon]|nr:P-type Ca2+ transporter type [Thermoproteota archaeon]
MTIETAKNWFSMDVDEILQELKTDRHGLDDEEAKRRLKQYGYNILKQEKAPGFLQLFLEQFKDFLIIILLAATILSFSMYFLNALGILATGEESPLDAIVILIIVIISAALGTIEEYRAEKSMEALKKMAAPTAKVIRNGKEMVISASELVPGDIVILANGDKVPTDARVIEEMNLQMDEAPLTGESIPVKKDVKSLSEGVYVADRKNMVFAATVVTYGHGKVVVTSTGMQTEIGRIAVMLQDVEEEKTPLEKRLDIVGKWLGGSMLGICAIVAGIYLIRDFLSGQFTIASILYVVMLSVSLSVAAVPEALAAVVTGALAIGVNRMAKRKAIVRRLPAVETLGCTTVICSDKTGTLTKNEMTVRRIYSNRKMIDCTGVGYEPKGEFRCGEMIENIEDNLHLLFRAAVLCNDASLDNSGLTWSIVGDPTEGALIVVAAKAGVLQEDVTNRYPRIGEIPFSSERKRMTTIHSVEGEKIAYMKGAPEGVLDRCNSILLDGREIVLSEEEKNAILNMNERMANEALRNLGLAYKKLTSVFSVDNIVEDEVEKDMVFLGLVGMIDPPRNEAITANNLCKKAGIRTVMITGDHKLTAVAVAKEIGIMEGDSLVLTGVELEKIPDAEYDKIVDKVAVYARVSPEHKMRIVKTLKKKGHVVAMTGDGVNDAPALKNADIGIAMGITGTDVTKEASDIILADDNFATIVSAIEEGRGIYDNIKKYLSYLLSVNLGEMAIIFVAGILGWPLPLVAVQLLWVNLSTDGLPAIALGVDPYSPDIMERSPRNPRESVFTPWIKLYIVVVNVAMTVVILGAFYLIWAGNPANELKARTVAFSIMVFSELLRAYTCRSESQPVFKVGMFKNRFLNVAILSSVLLQFAIILIPALDFVFDTVWLSFQDWMFIAPFCFVVFLSVELSKVIAPKVSKRFLL